MINIGEDRVPDYNEWAKEQLKSLTDDINNIKSSHFWFDAYYDDIGLTREDIDKLLSAIINIDNIVKDFKRKIGVN